MPDAARLVAAISLAVVAYFLSGLVIQVYEAEVAEIDWGYFVYVNMIVGMWVGWMSVGKRAGRSVSGAVTNGWTGVFQLMALGIFIQACNEMTRLAMKNKYDGAFEALAAIFEISVEYGLLIATAPILITMVVGGFVAGMLTEFAWRTWR